MDRELIEFLDRRFNQFKDELCAELRTEIAASAEETRRYVDTVVAASAESTRRHVGASAEETRRYVDATATETRRHFDVVAESLMGKIQLVGEGVLGVDQKVDRLANEMGGEFQKVDRHFLHLHAQLLGHR